MTLQRTLRNYFTDNGVLPFWADSAMNYVDRVLAGNRHFVSKLEKPSLRVSNGYVARFTCRAVVVLPDSDQTRTCRLTYTFDPDRKVSHKVTLT